ncbi:hypothetical protein GOODEAATRI_013973, partial [Goodea atripinnis]
LFRTQWHFLDVNQQQQVGADLADGDEWIYQHVDTCSCERLKDAAAFWVLRMRGCRCCRKVVAANKVFFGFVFTLSFNSQSDGRHAGCVWGTGRSCERTECGAPAQTVGQEGRPDGAKDGDGQREETPGDNWTCSIQKEIPVFPPFSVHAASIPFFACELKAVGPYKRGFICGDPSITYPYLHNEAIPDELLIAGGIFITGFAIALGECYRVRFQSISSKSFVRNRYVSCLYKELGSFLFGCCIGQSLTNMAKLSVGRLRPYFLSVCGITYASLNCTPGTYVATVTCRNPDHRLEEEARKSFFSGHASFAMYALLYLAARLTWRGARLLRPLLQSFLVLLAFYTGLTRISDYRHHPSDVLTGYTQGALTAYWVVSIPLLFCLVHQSVHMSGSAHVSSCVCV